MFFSVFLNVDFQLSVREHLLTVMVSECWHRFPGEVMESPSLETLKSRLDVVLSGPA